MNWTPKVIRTDSPLYASALNLRDRVLRKPLGLELTPADTELDEASLHCVLTDGEPVIAVAVVIPEDDRAKISQVVVDESHQGIGCGKAVMHAAESAAIELGLARCHLDARDGVVSFYRELGYGPAGKPFTKLGILHHPLEKRLNTSSQAVGDGGA